MVAMRRASIMGLIAATTIAVTGVTDSTAGEASFVWSRSPDGDLRMDVVGSDGRVASDIPDPTHTVPPAVQCPFADRLTTAALRVGLEPSIAIAVAYAETRCRHINQRSPKGALGLMQLMPATARRFGGADPWNIDQNIEAGVAYLQWLNARYSGDLQRTVAAYNAGEGAVDRYRGVPPYAETRAYVGAITRSLGASNSLEAQAAIDAVVEAKVQSVFVMTLAQDATIAARVQD